MSEIRLPIKLKEYLSTVTRLHIEAALLRTQNNRTQAADLLGLERTTLVEMMKRYGLLQRHRAQKPATKVCAAAIFAALYKHNGSRAKAARELGLNVSTFYRTVRRLGLNEKFPLRQQRRRSSG